MLALDSLRRVLGGRVGDLVPEHGRECRRRSWSPAGCRCRRRSCRPAGSRRWPRSCAAASPSRRTGLVAAGDGLDALGDPLYLRVVGAGETIPPGPARSVFAYCWLPSCACCSSREATCSVRWVTGVVCRCVAASTTPTTTAAITMAISGRRDEEAEHTPHNQTTMSPPEPRPDVRACTGDRSQRWHGLGRRSA